MRQSKHFDRCSLDFTVDSSRSEPGWIVGSVALVVGGCRIGEIEEEQPGLLIAAFEHVASYRSQRLDATLLATGAEAAIKQVDHALFVDDNRTDEEVASDAARFRPFVALPQHFPSWRGWFAILVEWADEARFIYSDPSGRVTDVMLEAGE